MCTLGLGSFVCLLFNCQLIFLGIDKASGGTIVNGTGMTQACSAQGLCFTWENVASSKKSEDFHFQNFFSQNPTSKNLLLAFACGFRRHVTLPRVK